MAEETTTSAKLAPKTAIQKLISLVLVDITIRKGLFHGFLHSFLNNSMHSGAKIGSIQPEFT